MSHRLPTACLLVVLGGACGKSTTAAEPPKSTPTPGSATTGSNATPQPAGPPSRGPEHAVFSLVDNRLGAHISRGGGLYIPGGSIGFAKYTRFNNIPKGQRPWLLAQKVKDAKGVRINGRVATMYVPLTAAQAKRGAVRMHAYAGAAGTLVVRANDGKEQSAKLKDGWSDIELAIPATELVEGENAITLYANAPDVAIEWMQVGGSAAPDTSAIYDATGDALVLPKSGQMSWYVLVPDKARVVGDLEGKCELVVTATADDGKTATGKLTGKGMAVELGAVAGKAARIDVEAQGCPSAKVANAALVVPGDAVAVKRGAPPKYVVFLIMDSLRFDRVRAYEPTARAETPNWEKLAESSTMFYQHYVQGNESQVSHASMWSSNYLSKHRAAQWEDNLDSKWMTIDKVAKAGGKFVAGVSANGYIRPSRGFGSAWDQYVNNLERELGLRGQDVLATGMSFITPRHDKPWFLYMGMIDTHVTWRGKHPWIDKYDPGYNGRFSIEFGDEPDGFPTDTNDREKDHVRALYDSNVSYQDDLLGKLRTQLETWGIWDQTMLVVTADHGDEQWEDGRIGHAGSLQETLIHVPMVIHYPPLFPAKKVASGSEGIDIVPTIADALGVKPDGEWQGASLVPLANGAVDYPLLATTSFYENFFSGRLGHYKIKISGGNPPKVVNLAKDPTEKTELYQTKDGRIAARMLIDPMWTLRQYNVEWKKAVWGNPANVTKQFAAEHGE